MHDIDAVQLCSGSHAAKLNRNNLVDWAFAVEPPRCCLCGLGGLVRGIDGQLVAVVAGRRNDSVVEVAGCHASKLHGAPVTRNNNPAGGIARERSTPSALCREPPASAEQATQLCRLIAQATLRKLVAEFPKVRRRRPCRAA